MERAFALILTLVLLLLTGGAASASEQSKRLYSRGLVQFHAGRFSQALQLFEAAVKADPKDPYALYYRGVTRGRLGDFAGAVEDLRVVLASKVALKQAPLELGVALVQLGEYREAVPWLEEAERVTTLGARASLFLGIAQLRLGQTAAAGRSFERAAARDPALDLPARYYQGVVAYQEGRWSQAEEHFSYVATTNPSSTMGREAAAFLQNIRGAERAAAEVYGAVGFQYDSNVVLAPSEDVVKNELQISQQEDGRATITVGGAYTPWRTEQAELSVGYELYQSLHFDLTDFNIQDHRPTVQLATNAGMFQFGLLCRYDYYLLDTDSFLQEATALPWVAVVEGERGRTELSYRMRRRDFFKQLFRERDAFNHAAGIRQLVYLGSPDRYVSVGYRFDREEPISTVGQVFAYDGHEADAGFGWAFPAEITAEVIYAYRNERYAEESNGRRDNEHQVGLSVYKRLNEYLALTGGYLGTLNNSTKREFDYDRHIASLALEVRFH